MRNCCTLQQHLSGNIYNCCLMWTDNCSAVVHTETRKSEQSHAASGTQRGITVIYGVAGKADAKLLITSYEGRHSRGMVGETKKERERGLTYYNKTGLVSL